MSEKATCAQRIRQGLEARGMTQKEVCDKTGIPKSAMSQYCNGAFVPKQNRTALIAQALNVNEGWLMGYDVPMEPRKPSSLKLKDIMNPPWKSDKKARLYMCIDSWLLGVLEAEAQEQNKTLEDEIEEILYWEIENRIEEWSNEETARMEQEWYDRHYTGTQDSTPAPDTVGQDQAPEATSGSGWDDDIEREVEDYRRRLLLEKRQAGEPSPSSADDVTA